MDSSLAQFYKLRDKIRKAGETLGSLLPPRPQPRRVLYHYTSAEGLHGIITTGSLWATHLRHLNDSSELRYGIDLLVERIERLEPQGVALDVSSREELRAAVIRLLKAGKDTEFHMQLWNSTLSAALKIAGRSMPYVCCFCERPDLLSQWRGYGDHGVGFSLGINTEQLPFLDANAVLGTERVAERERVFDLPSLVPASFLSKLIYSKRKQQELAERLVDAATRMGHEIISVESFQILGVDDQAAVLLRVADMAVSQATYAVADFKDPSFAEEHEWRLVTRPDLLAQHHPSHRVTGGRIVPYVSIPLWSESDARSKQRDAVLKEIWCGPSPTAELAEHGVQSLLHAHGFRKCRVKRSAIPFRTNS